MKDLNKRAGYMLAQMHWLLIVAMAAVITFALGYAYSKAMPVSKGIQLKLDHDYNQNVEVIRNHTLTVNPDFILASDSSKDKLKKMTEWVIRLYERGEEYVNSNTTIRFIFRTDRFFSNVTPQTVVEMKKGELAKAKTKAIADWQSRIIEIMTTRSEAFDQIDQLGLQGKKDITEADIMYWEALLAAYNQESPLHILNRSQNGYEGAVYKLNMLLNTDQNPLPKAEGYKLDPRYTPVEKMQQTLKATKSKLELYVAALLLFALCLHLLFKVRKEYRKEVTEKIEAKKSILDNLKTELKEKETSLVHARLLLAEKELEEAQIKAIEVQEESNQVTEQLNDLRPAINHLRKSTGTEVRLEGYLNDGNKLQAEHSQIISFANAYNHREEVVSYIRQAEKKLEELKNKVPEFEAKLAAEGSVNRLAVNASGRDAILPGTASAATELHNLLNGDIPEAKRKLSKANMALKAAESKFKKTIAGKSTSEIESMTMTTLAFKSVQEDGGVAGLRKQLEQYRKVRNDEISEKEEEIKELEQRQDRLIGDGIDLDMRINTEKGNLDSIRNEIRQMGDVSFEDTDKQKTVKKLKKEISKLEIEIQNLKNDIEHAKEELKRAKTSISAYVETKSDEKGKGSLSKFVGSIGALIVLVVGSIVTIFTLVFNGIGRMFSGTGQVFGNIGDRLKSGKGRGRLAILVTLVFTIIIIIAFWVSGWVSQFMS